MRAHCPPALTTGFGVVCLNKKKPKVLLTKTSASRPTKNALHHTTANI